MDPVLRVGPDDTPARFWLCRFGLHRWGAFGGEWGGVMNFWQKHRCTRCGKVKARVVATNMVGPG